MEPLDIEPLDMEPLDIEPDDWLPGPLDIDPLEPDPFDIEPLLEPCANAAPATTAPTISARPVTLVLRSISFLLKDKPHGRGSRRSPSGKHRRAALRRCPMANVARARVAVQIPAYHS